MAAVVNPSGSQTLDAYTSAAKGVTTAVAPASGPFGGKVGSGTAQTSTGTGASPSCTPGSGGAGGYRVKRAACGNGAGNLPVPLAVAGGIVGLVGAAAFLL